MAKKGASYPAKTYKQGLYAKWLEKKPLLKHVRLHFCRSNYTTPCTYRHRNMYPECERKAGCRRYCTHVFLGTSTPTFMECWSNRLSINERRRKAKLNLASLRHHKGHSSLLWQIEHTDTSNITSSQIDYHENSSYSWTSGSKWLAAESFASFRNCTFSPLSVWNHGYRRD